MADGFLAKKLDRDMANSLWLDTFSDCEVKFRSPEFSDHCAGLIINKAHMPQRKRPFKFFNYKHRSFMSEI